MNGLLADLRMAFRGLRKAPGFTISAIVILALGIGANITAFSALKVAVLTPPPFPEADRMVSVDLTRTDENGERISRWAYPYAQRLSDWPDRLIEPVTGYRERVVTLTGFGPASQLPIEVVSTDGCLSFFLANPFGKRPFGTRAGDSTERSAFRDCGCGPAEFLRIYR
jgi:hypothetical protein